MCDDVSGGNYKWSFVQTTLLHSQNRLGGGQDNWDTCRSCEPGVDKGRRLWSRQILHDEESSYDMIQVCQGGKLCNKLKQTF